MNDLLSPAHKQQLLAHWHPGMLEQLSRYSHAWALTNISLLPSFTPNALFTCLYRGLPAVLKLGPVTHETAHQAAALRAYNGQRFCRLFQSDPAGGALLMQHVLPGTPLRSESDLETRLAVFTTLFQTLHLPAPTGHHFPTYTGWVERITSYMQRKEGFHALTTEMLAACDIHHQLAALYPAEMLLHGDLHHDNILKNGDGYTLIDPKGVIGDPIFDTPRFLLNEFIFTPLDEAALQRVATALTTLTHTLGYPRAHLAQCLYAETAMAYSWHVESGAKPVEEAHFLEAIQFTKRFL